MIVIIKLLSLILGLTVICKTYYGYKKHQESLATFLFWSFTWLTIIYASIEPQKIYAVMQSFNKNNIGLGTFGGIAFIFLFYVTYRVYTKANRLERKLHDIVTKLGLKEIENKE
jgi:hypothetical protein